MIRVQICALLRVSSRVACSLADHAVTIIPQPTDQTAEVGELGGPIKLTTISKAVNLGR